jgi:hypothetical protein
MQTKTYAELFALIQALCGVVFASIETPRIKALINRRAMRAYRASNYWTRFLKIGEERVVSSSIIPYSEGSLSSIDTFLRVYKQAPYVASSVQEYDIMVTSAGATLVCGDLNPSEAYVTYKAQLSDTYGDGSGESTTIPAEWYQYMAHGTYADYLRAEGQQEKSVIADQEAELLLQDEMIRLDENHTSGLVSNRIFTNANMQMRY